jgi:hypothetical protein
VSDKEDAQRGDNYTYSFTRSGSFFDYEWGENGEHHWTRIDQERCVGDCCLFYGQNECGEMEAKYTAGNRY